MGNLFTKQNNALKSESRSFGHVIDYIASHYILTMDFESLTKLYDKQYCDNLVVLTKDIIDRNFNDLEITYLAQRTQKGVVIDKETTDKVVFFNKQELDKLDVGTALKKKRICIGIAKFYVKIAHLFASIVSTINPVYSYKDEQGNLIQQTMANKNQIPPNVGRKLHKMGLCNRRIDILKGTQDWNKIPINGDIIVNPKICTANSSANIDMNTNMNNIVDDDTNNQSHPNYNNNNNGMIGGNNNPQVLDDEPGIPELMHLYCDKISTTDNFQTTCDFTSMSDNAKNEYMKDLKKFYTTFTGKSESEIPQDLTSFSQIRLQDYNDKKGCQQNENGQNGPLNKSYSGNLKDELFKKYAENLRSMIQNANTKQQQLLDIINELFTYDIVDDKKLIRVKPTLTETILQGLVEKTRKIIVDLYITCENDFETGVKLYEAIVENQILITTQLQIKELDKVAQETYSSFRKPNENTSQPVQNVNPEFKAPIITTSTVVEPALVEPTLVNPALVEPAVIEPTVVVEPVLVNPAAIEPQLINNTETLNQM